jgi:hypothetical protein
MILSVSRRTDVPAFYSSWFYNRIKEGFALVRNPINHRQVGRVSLSADVIDCIVFWTKNPKPMLENLGYLDSYLYYFLFTLNSYDRTMEINLPEKAHLIETFQDFSEKLGRDRVIWRYDPILLTKKFTKDWHYRWFDFLCRQLCQYTRRCIISFYDPYAKSERNLKGTGMQSLAESDMLEMVSILSGIAGGHGIRLEACCEPGIARTLNVPQGKCIDARLISNLAGDEFNIKKDPHQRESCGCVQSIDIGEYNTCGHRCLYCYANHHPQSVSANCARHDSGSPLLVGKVGLQDKVYEREVYSYRNRQACLFKT